MESEEEKSGRNRVGKQWSWMGYAYLSVLTHYAVKGCQSSWHALNYLNESMPCWKYMERQLSAAFR